MRGINQQADMFSFLWPRQKMRKDHLLRAVRATDEILEWMWPLFDAMYASGGQPSISPQQLLRAQLLQMLYSVRSERLLMEETDYSILYRWLGGLNLDEKVWDATTFTKNRNRLLEAEVSKEFLAQVVCRAREVELISDEHFTVDGTLLEAWASLKSFRSTDEKPSAPPNSPGNPIVDFHGEKRYRRAHDAARWLCHRLEKAQVYRGVFRVAERHRVAAEAETSRTLQSGIDFTFAAAAYGLVRLRRLVPIPASA